MADIVSSLYVSCVRKREVNKWTQLFDVTVIFIHMDLSAASECIVVAHLNHSAAPSHDCNSFSPAWIYEEVYS